MSQAKIILVAGPTASGKSAFALDLAYQKQGSIINADAMQVYAGLPILSAGPTALDQQNIPHLLYHIIPPHQRSSAGTWTGMAQDAISTTLEAGRIPILVGGTGLYFRALLGGLANIPPIPDEVRHKVQEQYDLWGEDGFRSELSKIDAQSAARLARNDRQRLIRAYEVASYTGHPLSYWHQNQASTPSPYAIEAHLLMPEREELYAACDKRFLSMVQKGVLMEVSQFMELDLKDDLPVMKTLGLRELIAHLRHELSLDEAVAKAQQATRNYAKRQMTWFRHQWPF